MQGRGRHRPSMTDVARVAGVSHQTVSRVLNGSPNVAPATRARVEAAMEELQYRRNFAARALARRRSQILGVLAFGTHYYGPANMLRGIQAAARSAGYFVCVTSLEDTTSRTVRDHMTMLAELGPEGVIVIAPYEAAVKALENIADGTPAVAVEGGQGTPNVPVVCIDQEAAGRIVTQHLLRLGHATVHHVGGPPAWLEARGRERGWRSCLEAAGAAVPEPWYGDWGSRSGYEIGLDVAARGDVTGLFVANDQMALGVLRAFRERGVAVPDDISVVGFDDVPEAEFFATPLTTIRQDFLTVGSTSLQVVLDIIEGRDVAHHHVIAPELVVRASTGPARAPAPRGR